MKVLPLIEVWFNKIWGSKYVPLFNFKKKGVVKWLYLYVNLSTSVVCNLGNEKTSQFLERFLLNNQLNNHTFLVRRWIQNIDYFLW